MLIDIMLLALTVCIILHAHICNISASLSPALLAKC